MDRSSPDRQKKMNSCRKVVGALELEKATLGNIIAFPSVGRFNFNTMTGTTLSDGTDKLIWGIKEDDTYNFERALSAIRPDYRQLFTDKSIGSIGKETQVEFDLILENGNHTHEVYQIVGHEDDYKITGSPISIKGITRLVKVA